MGLAAYGRAFKLKPGSADMQPGRADFTGPAPAGECTVAHGTLAYYEIKRRLGGKAPTIDRTRLAAYAAYGNNQHWVGFDNQDTLR
jgi:hypothetical protein